MPEKLSETFQVDVTGRNPETGDRIEPEQAPAAQVTEMAPVLRMQNESGLLEDGRPVSALGSMPVNIAVEAPAGTLAMNLASQCAECRYWSPEAWKKVKGGLERSLDASSRAQLEEYRNNVRFMIADAPEAGGNALFDPEGHDRFEADVERHLNSMGVCYALTELFANVPEELGGRGAHLTFPSGGCPVGMEVPGVGTTVGDMWKPKDAEAKKESAMSYDSILLAAARQTLK